MLAAFNLIDYGPNPDINTGLSDPDDDNFSGVTYSRTSNTLFIIDDAGEGDIYEYDIDGGFRREVDLDNFLDPEGIVHLGGDRFAIVEEGIKEITKVTITANTTTIDKNSIPAQDSFFVSHPNLGPADTNDNSGLESIAYDEANGFFYVVKEKNPIRIFRIPENGGAVDEITVPNLTNSTNTMLDASDAHFANDSLFIVSDKSRNIVKVSVDPNTTSGSLVPGQEINNLPFVQFEGITFTPGGEQMFVVGEPRNFLRYTHQPLLVTSTAGARNGDRSSLFLVSHSQDK